MNLFIYLYNKVFKPKKYGGEFSQSSDISSARVSVNSVTMPLSSWILQNLNNYVSTMIASGLNNPKLWYGTTTTTTNGLWVVTFPSNTFTTNPQIFCQALSADTTLANSAFASLTARSTTSASGVVTLPNTIAIGGAPNKAAGAGLTVCIFAIGY